MRKFLMVVPFVLGFAAVAIAGIGPAPVCTPAVPEIDAAGGAAALALVAGAVLLIRGRRKA
jgi:hypothetical protein